MSHPSRCVVRHGERSVTADVLTDGSIRIEGCTDPFVVQADGPGTYLVSDGNRRWRVSVAGSPDATCVSVGGIAGTVEIVADGDRGPRKKRGGHGDASAPMPATVIEIMVVAGQSVDAGDVVLKLEAMKMELPVRAPRAGTVSAIHCQKGEMVQAGVVLVDIT